MESWLQPPHPLFPLFQTNGWCRSPIIWLGAAWGGKAAGRLLYILATAQVWTHTELTTVLLHRVLLYLVIDLMLLYCFSCFCNKSQKGTYGARGSLREFSVESCRHLSRETHTVLTCWTFVSYTINSTMFHLPEFTKRQSRLSPTNLFFKKKSKQNKKNVLWIYLISSRFLLLVLLLQAFYFLGKVLILQSQISILKHMWLVFPTRSFLPIIWSVFFKSKYKSKIISLVLY